jgi:hypothetical protein
MTSPLAHRRHGRVAALLGMAAVTAVLAVPVNARAAVVLNETLPFSSVEAGCDEAVQLDGTVHILVSETQNGDTSHFDTRTSFHGDAVGVSSGARYVFSGGGVFSETVRASFIGVLNTLGQFTLVGQGGVPNLRATSHLHLTFDANGRLTAQIDDTSLDCQ